MANMGTRNVTAAELPHIPAAWRNELVRGEVRPMTPPHFPHARVAELLAEIIGPYVRSRGLGLYLGPEAGYLIERNPDTVRTPDGAFLTKAHLARTGSPQGYFEGAPDVAIEIVSPGDRLKKVREKAQMWVQTGAVMAVVIDPIRRTVVIQTSEGERALPEHGALEFGSLIPGLSIPLADLFAEA